VVVDDEGLVGQGSSFAFVAHFWRKDENQVHYVVGGYVGAVDGVETRHLESEVRQMVSNF
jgi:hypothetical protein